MKLGGENAYTALLCVHREITQRPLSTEHRLIFPYVCFAIHVIRGMHSLHVCVSLGQAGNSLDIGGNLWLLSERLRVIFTTQQYELTGCVFWLF